MCLASLRPIPFAVSPPVMAFLSSAALGLAIFMALWTFQRILTTQRAPSSNSFERQRRELLRTQSATYRWFEPLVLEIARLCGFLQSPTLKHNLELCPKYSRWTPTEFLAAKLIESTLLAGATLVIMGSLVGAFPGIVFALLASWAYYHASVNQVSTLAENRMRSIKNRLPFAIDMMALMMSAGATFQESLGTVVRENREHAIGEEFGVVNNETALGRTRREALLALEHRLDDDDVREFVFSVVKGEELGTPLSKIFANQADQLRLKRSQWVEKASAEAQVKIVYPGLLIMIACLFIVLAPFLLKVTEAV